MVKNVIIMALFLLFFSSSAHAGKMQQNDSFPLSNSLSLAYDIYIKCPSKINASNLSLYISKIRSNEPGYTYNKKDGDFIYDNLCTLTRNIEGRDRLAVRIAFGLTHIVAGGGFHEDICASLGKLIRIDPELFLEELKYSNPEGKFIEGPVVIVIGCTDYFEAKCFEYRRRIESLNTVKNSSLEKYRDTCIEMLSELITEYCKEMPCGTRD